MNLSIKLRNYMARVIGRISSLDTIDKTNVVSSINEIHDDLNKVVLSREIERLVDLPEDYNYTLAEDNIELVDSNGVALILSDVEQEYPNRRIDNQRELGNTGYDYTLLTSLSESSVNRLEFSPTVDLLFSENHSRVGFIMLTDGTGYTTIEIELHDALDNVLDSTTVTEAHAPASGWFYVDLVATLVPGDIYHYHVYTSGGGAAPVIGSYILEDFSEGKFKQMYMPDSGKYGGANEDDTIRLYNGSDTSKVITTNGSTDDDLAFQGDPNGNNSFETVDIMAVDFSIEDFDTWTYNEYSEYIGVDATNGKIRINQSVSDSSLGFDIANLYAKYNISTKSWKTATARDIMVNIGGESIASALRGGLVPIGRVIMNPVDDVPLGFIRAEGTAISRTEFAEAFKVLGVTYGNGDGSTTFNVQDYRGYCLRGTDRGAGIDPDTATRTDRGDGTAGDNVGTVQPDALQGFHITDSHVGVFSSPYTTPMANGTYLSVKTTNRTPISDGSNGTPRTTSETRSINKNIDFIVRIF